MVIIVVFVQIINTITYKVEYANLVKTKSNIMNKV